MVFCDEEVMKKIRGVVFLDGCLQTFLFDFRLKNAIFFFVVTILALSSNS